MSTPTCPNCGGHQFHLDVMQRIQVVFDDDDHEVVDGPEGDMEWDDDTLARCVSCSHQGKLSDMREV
jgi:hypothetical protein